MLKMSLEINSDCNLLSAIRVLVRQVVSGMEFSEHTIDQIVLAVDEACANIIRHCYHMEDDQKIILSIIEERDGLRFELKDFGPSQSLEQFIHRKLEDVRPGGLGVYFIKQIMDNIDLKNETDGNRLIMVKKFEKNL